MVWTWQFEKADGTPASAAASSRLGVISSARGKSRSIIKRVPAASTRSAPELDLRMGSSTTCGSRACSRKSATARTTGSLPSIPMWTAAMAKSDASASSESDDPGIDRLDPADPLGGLDG